MSNDIGDWYRGIPQFTRYWFTGVVGLSLLGRFGIFSPMTLILEYYAVVYHFQIWRPFTSAVYYPITPQTGFHFLILLYFLYSYSSRLETGVFDGRPADYLFMLLFNWFVLVLVGLAANIMLLLDPMIMGALYVWCQINRDQIVQFWFGTQFKAAYLPWILLAFNLITRGSYLPDLVGILVGHLYFFLMFKYPQDFGGRQFLSTPSIFYKWFPNRRGGVAGFGMAPSSRRQQQDDGNPVRHRWGTGQQLGGD